MGCKFMLKCECILLAKHFMSNPCYHGTHLILCLNFLLLTELSLLFWQGECLCCSVKASFRLEACWENQWWRKGDPHSQNNTGHLIPHILFSPPTVISGILSSVFLLPLVSHVSHINVSQDSDKLEREVNREMPYLPVISVECVKHWGSDSPFIAWLAGYICRWWVRKGAWRYFLSLRFPFFSSDLLWACLNLLLLPTSIVFLILGLISHFPRSFSGLCISWPWVPYCS